MALVFARGLYNKGIEWHGDYADVDLKAMGNFPFSPAAGTRDDVPARWRALDGKRVQLEGFMWSPVSAGTRGTEFQFVYNINICCIGGPPQVQERVFGYADREVPIFRYRQLARGPDWLLLVRPQVRSQNNCPI